MATRWQSTVSEKTCQDFKRNGKEASLKCSAGDRHHPLNEDTYTRREMSSSHSVSKGVRDAGLHGGRNAPIHSDGLRSSGSFKEGDGLEG